MGNTAGVLNARVSQSREVNLGFGKYPLVIMRNEATGDIYIGGHDAKLTMLNKDLRIVKTVEFEAKWHHLMAGICFQNRIYCGLHNDTIEVYDKYLTLIKKIYFKAGWVTKFLPINE